MMNQNGDITIYDKLTGQATVHEPGGSTRAATDAELLDVLRKIEADQRERAERCARETNVHEPTTFDEACRFSRQQDRALNDIRRSSLTRADAYMAVVRREVELAADDLTPLYKLRVDLRRVHTALKRHVRNMHTEGGAL